MSLVWRLYIMFWWRLYVVLSLDSLLGNRSNQSQKFSQFPAVERFSTEQKTEGEDVPFTLLSVVLVIPL